MSKPPVTSCLTSGGDGPHAAGRCGGVRQVSGVREKPLGETESLAGGPKRMTEASNNGRNDRSTV